MTDKIALDRTELDRIARIFDAVADLPPAERVRIAQRLYDRYVLSYGLMAPTAPLNFDLVEIHMDAATKRSALE